jgi:hypothetical protein
VKRFCMIMCARLDCVCSFASPHSVECGRLPAAGFVHVCALHYLMSVSLPQTIKFLGKTQRLEWRQPSQ